MSASNYASAAMLNALFGKSSDFGALSSAPDMFLAASTTDPAEDGSNITEPSTSGTAYARLDVSGTDFVAATDANPSVLTNAGTLSFNQATGAGWGTITHLALMDGGTVGAGEMILRIPLSEAQIIGLGATLEFEAGLLTVTMT
jgi:hypothetical protein